LQPSILATHANHRTDPTQTTVIRNQFSAAMSTRFRSLKRALLTWIATNSASLSTGLFFVEEFMRVAEREEERLIFEENGAAWMLPYLTQAFVRGLQHADKSTGLKGIGVKPIMLDGAVNYQREIDVIQAQNFRLLKGITEVMNLRIKALLTEGIVTGMNPKEVGRLITKNVEGIGARRGIVLARTETIRAHAEATLTRLADYGFDSVMGQAEFRTAQDDRVCARCAGLNGQVYSLAQAKGVIPVHVLCRCVWLPVIPQRLHQPIFITGLPVEA
jgi:SPP1 gp7 family putative phage head morphogenesis protein